MKIYLLNLILISFSSECWERKFIESGMNGSSSFGPIAMVMTACAMKNRIGQQPDDLCRITRMLLHKADKHEEKWQKNKQHYVFYGKVGTGKTSAVDAIADISKTPVKRMLASSLNNQEEMGCKMIDSIFNEALIQADKENNSIIVFFDEIETLVSTRDKENCSERKKMLETLCSWLQKLKNDKRIVFIGATNTIQNLDQKFKNCIDKNFVEFPLPNKEVREEMIKIYLEKQGCRISANDMFRLVKASEGLNYSNIEMCIQEVLKKDPLEKISIDTLCAKFTQTKKS